MLNPKTLLNIICTEAIEYSGQQEVPDNKHGANQNFHARKREARSSEASSPPDIDTNHEELEMCYMNELVLGEDGRLEWVD